MKYVNLMEDVSTLLPFPLTLFPLGLLLRLYPSGVPFCIYLSLTSQKFLWRRTFLMTRNGFCQV